MGLQRFSSRRHQIDQVFLLQRLQGAKAYDRIAGYFSSSLLEVAGQALEQVRGPIRIVCNSELDIRDVETARSARDALYREWCTQDRDHFLEANKERFIRLYRLLQSGNMQVKVLPSNKFGLEHGKAGVITLANGQKTAFVGSTNDTYHAWRVNYELVWEDDSPESIEWVQEEFDALWNHPTAVLLADAVIEDIARISRRTIIPTIEVWRNRPEPAAPIIETPIYRQENGLWEHQKYFIQLAFEAHQTLRSARFVLADMVGLGKTIQLAVTALLMALYGERPILILAPRSLVLQWQSEMKSLLDMPSAVWTGKKWLDENGVASRAIGERDILYCPRRVGIISHGVITSASEAASYLGEITYECIIVDEAHRARRKNSGASHSNKKSSPNNLLAFLLTLAKRTKSMLLATATPVQVSPNDAFDLLRILATGCEEPTGAWEDISFGSQFVLGNRWSKWRKQNLALDVVLHGTIPPKDELWEWIRNPLPPGGGDPEVQTLLRALDLDGTQATAPGSLIEKLDKANLARIQRLGHNLPRERNPFIRHIVRRTRQFLEETINPKTNEPYLQAVRVERFGEGEEDAIPMPSYLENAYRYAQEFCKLLSARKCGTGLLQTLLLRRVGSTVHAGLCTARAMLKNWEDDDEDIEEALEGDKPKQLLLKDAEKSLLKAFIALLEAHQEYDPKYEVITKTLLEAHWLERGCIIFSQYLDSILWLAERLSKDLPDMSIGVYASSQHSRIYINRQVLKVGREDLKQQVQHGTVQLLLGTDAASEGLNLQRLGSLINFDLPWNPTRLEQRKGRIQRIGQIHETIFLYNMRYKESIEDRVHQLLSQRLETIYKLFGQLPDVLEDAWVNAALDRRKELTKIIGAIPEKHPFEMKYNQIAQVPWETCAEVLDASEQQKYLLQGWSSNDAKQCNW